MTNPSQKFPNAEYLASINCTARSAGAKLTADRDRGATAAVVALTPISLVPNRPRQVVLLGGELGGLQAGEVLNQELRAVVIGGIEGDLKSIRARVAADVVLAAIRTEAVRLKRPALPAQALAPGGRGRGRCRASALEIPQPGPHSFPISALTLGTGHGAAVKGRTAHCRNLIDFVS